MSPFSQCLRMEALKLPLPLHFYCMLKNILSTLWWDISVLQTIWLSCSVGILLNLSEASRWNPSHKPRLYKQSQSGDWSDVKPRSNCRHEDSIKEALKCDNTFRVSHQEKLGIFSQHLSFNKVPMFPFRRHQTHIRASPTWIKRSIKVF